MYVHALIRASLGFVGFCLVAFVQQSASGSKTTQGKFFTPKIASSSSSSFFPPLFNAFYSWCLGKCWCLINSGKAANDDTCLNKLDLNLMCVLNKLYKKRQISLQNVEVKVQFVDALMPQFTLPDLILQPLNCLFCCVSVLSCFYL